MRTLPDPRLYHDTAYCLQYLRQLTRAPTVPDGPKERFHFYWHGPFGRKPAFALKSFLATQDLGWAEPWLWLDSQTGERESLDDRHLTALQAHVRVLRYDPAALARETPLERSPEVLNAAQPAERSNVFRLLVLHHHGGTYVDIDTLFLRDFRDLVQNPLGQDDFCYRWSCQPEWATNAITRVPPDSPQSRDLLERARVAGSCNPRALFKGANYAEVDLLELPCIFFDPLWPHVDRHDRYHAAPFQRFSDFFRPFGLWFRPKQRVPTLQEFFPGAFAYQWHGLWQAPEHPRSYFGHLERAIDRLVEERLGIRVPATSSNV